MYESHTDPIPVYEIKIRTTPENPEKEQIRFVFRIAFISSLLFLLLALTSGCGVVQMFYDYHKAERTRYVELNGDMDNETRDAILAGRVRVGMTLDDCRTALNRDSMRLVSQSSDGSRVYDTIYARTFLYFENDTLVRWDCVP